MKISVVSGGFDPIHSGHIEYLKAAKLNSDKLIVLLNSDMWLEQKKGKFFMPFSERKTILANLSMVDEVVGFEDDKEGTCKNGLLKLKKDYPKDEIYFCNGGDRNEENIPEASVKDIHLVFGVGGNEKKNSSSWILKKWAYDHEKRVWGEFYNLFEDDKVKVKELILFPKKGMSLQKHFHRDEIWFISSGKCIVNYSKHSPTSTDMIELDKDDTFNVLRGEWHQLVNPTNNPCHIIEIQFGSKTSEDDIERYSYYDSN
jgi:cytidyltransferase-like protein